MWATRIQWSILGGSGMVVGWISVSMNVDTDVLQGVQGEDD